MGNNFYRNQYRIVSQKALGRNAQCFFGDSIRKGSDYDVKTYKNPVHLFLMIAHKYHNLIITLSVGKSINSLITGISLSDDLGSIFW